MSLPLSAEFATQQKQTIRKYIFDIHVQELVQLVTALQIVTSSGYCLNQPVTVVQGQNYVFIIICPQSIDILEQYDCIFETP